MTPLVTVLTCTFNAERFLDETIESIRAQTFRDWEYVVVDDASSDDTVAILERYAARDDRLRIVRRSENGGPYVAANQGFAEASGTYVARIDADDVALPHRLERQLAFLDTNRNLRACTSEIELLEDGQTRPMTGEYPGLPGALKWRLFFRIPMPSTTLMEKAAWKDVGGFRELPLSQDLRMWCDLSRHHWLGFIAEPLVQWRIHGSQLTATRSQLQTELATQAMKDHIREIAGEEWTDDQVVTLRSIGMRDVGVRAGFDAIKAWDRLWRRDATLTEADRTQLTDLSRRLRRWHLRASAREALNKRPAGRAALRLRARRKAH